MTSAAAAFGLPRTEVEVMADAIWRLVERRVIKNDAATIREAATALGISVDDVRLASIRLERRAYRPPRQQGTRLALVEDAPTISGGGRGSKRGTPNGTARETPDGIEIHCCRCRTWKPQEDFGVKDHQTGRRKSMCRPCVSDYQRERYLTVQDAEHLGALLTFRLVDGDAAVGHTCPTCERVLKIGDEVQGEARLRHKGCA